MPDNAVLVVEQPELHLHPQAQARLADVFTLAAAYKKRIVAETHSDHLIRGLQLAVSRTNKETMETTTGSPVTVIYTPDGNQAIRKIGITPEGDFSEAWPEGFLDVGYTTLLNKARNTT
jgi:predicted ATPase